MSANVAKTSEQSILNKIHTMHVINNYVENVMRSLIALVVFNIINNVTYVAAIVW